MNRLKGFTDEEVYLIKRVFAEASFEIAMTDRYTEEQIKLYDDLYNEIIEEDRERLYKDDYKTIPEIIVTDENVIEELLKKERTMTNKKELKNIKCPHCGESYYREDYSTVTCMYCPTIIKDGKVISRDNNTHTRHCHCLNCGKEFSYIEGEEPAAVLSYEECLNGEEVCRPATKEELEFLNTQDNLSKEETVENELTYEEALSILFSHSDTTDENWKCRCILEEAIERLRKYERDYADKLVDEFMAKTVITETARTSE